MNENGNIGNESGPSIDYWQIVKNRYGVILLTFLLVFMTAAVITSVMPRKFESTSVVQVHPSMIAINPIGNGSGVNPGAQMTRNYMENEFQTIVAAETLKMAADKISLPSRWSMEMDDVISNLKGIVGASPMRGTDFIEIRVRHAKPEDAKEIADAVSQAYMERRKQSEVNRAKRALDALDEELISQSDKVQDHRKDLTVLIQQYGIPKTKLLFTSPSIVSLRGRGGLCSLRVWGKNIPILLQLINRLRDLWKTLAKRLFHSRQF